MKLENGPGDFYTLGSKLPNYSNSIVAGGLGVVS